MSSRDRVLSALRAAVPSGVSGERMARDLGISRAAVAKHVAALKSSGYEIEARVGEGYRLLATPHVASPAEVVPLLTDELWVRVEGGEVTGSTNDDARVLARQGAAEGTVVVASHQTAGRGRLGRDWASPRGGAYLSVILRPAVSLLELSALPLVIAVGVAQGLESLGAAPALKWPNDVELVGRKVAGILVEVSAQSDRPDWVVVGVGLNIADVPEQPNAIGLASVLPHVAPAQAAAAALDGIAASYRRWVELGFAAIEPDFSARHRLAGERVTVRDLTGSVTAEGVVCGIDDLGRLLVEDAHRVRAVAAGEATLSGID